MSLRRTINQKDKPREAHFLMSCLRAKEARITRGEKQALPWSPSAGLVPISKMYVSGIKAPQKITTERPDTPRILRVVAFRRLPHKRWDPRKMSFGHE